MEGGLARNASSTRVNLQHQKWYLPPSVGQIKFETAREGHLSSKSPSYTSYKRECWVSYLEEYWILSEWFITFEFGDEMVWKTQGSDLSRFDSVSEEFWLRCRDCYLMSHLMNAFPWLRHLLDLHTFLSKPGSLWSQCPPGAREGEIDKNAYSHRHKLKLKRKNHVVIKSTCFGDHSSSLTLTKLLDLSETGFHYL